MAKKLILSGAFLCITAHEDAQKTRAFNNCNKLKSGAWVGLASYYHAQVHYNSADATATCNEGFPTCKGKCVASLGPFL